MLPNHPSLGQNHQEMRHLCLLPGSPHSLLPHGTARMMLLISDRIISLSYLKPIGDFPIILRINPHPLTSLHQNLATVHLAISCGHRRGWRSWGDSSSQLQPSFPSRSWSLLLPPSWSTFSRVTNPRILQFSVLPLLHEGSLFFLLPGFPAT